MKDRSDIQNEIFNDWKVICTKLASLNSIVQNDYKRLFDNGYVLKSEIEQSLKEFDFHFEQRISELFILRSKVQSLCEEVIEEA